MNFSFDRHRMFSHFQRITPLKIRSRTRRSPHEINKSACLADGAAFSLMVGLGENYIPAFALALGMGKVVGGLITVIPVVIAATLQLFSLHGVRALKSHKKWVVLCVVIQAASFLPLAAAALSGAWLWPDSMAPQNPRMWPLVFFMVTLYWVGGMLAGPPWNRWMGELIPTDERAPFFAARGRLMHFLLLGGLVLGGLTLDLFRHSEGLAPSSVLLGFGVLFLVASIARFVSAAYLNQQSELPATLNDDVEVSTRTWIERLRSHSGGQLMIYMLIVQFAVQISAPFTAPFMLSQLKLSYSTFMILTAVPLLTKMAFMPAIGKIASRKSAHSLLALGGLLMIPSPLLWSLSSQPIYLGFLQFLSGIAWGAYELAAFLLFYETIPAKERTSVQSKFNFANALALVAGSSLGGYLLSQGGESLDGFYTAFYASTAARIGSAVVLWHLVKRAFQEKSKAATDPLAA